MAEVVVIEFASPGAVRIYNEVNKIIGWEGVPDSEAWPSGMISQLAPAFKEANVPPPARLEWFSGVMNVHS